MWRKGDLVYIPSNTRLRRYVYDPIDTSAPSNTTMQRLSKPSLGVVASDIDQVIGMRYVFITDLDGLWYVEEKNIYEWKRTENEV
jgi:hypothetical protein